MEQTQILDHDKSALLDIFVWLFLISSVLGVAVEVVTKLVIRRRLGVEDYLILLSLVCHINMSLLPWSLNLRLPSSMLGQVSCAVKSTGQTGQLTVILYA